MKKAILIFCIILNVTYATAYSETFLDPVSWTFFPLFNIYSLKIKDFSILLPKLFWPTVRKKCFSDREKLLKFEAEGREFEKNLRSLEQFIQTVKGQNNFW